MKQMEVKRRRILSRRSEMIANSQLQGVQWIQIRRLPEEKPRGRGVLKKKALKLLFAAGWIFWFLFLGGFLVTGVQLPGRLSRLSAKDFFYALECHKYLWYIGGVWKKNP